MTPCITRLAPSPTGALHLGNACTFLANWALARQRGWTVLMRMEDLDGPRVKGDAAADALDLIAWLGIDHDGPVVTQSDDLEPMAHALRTLAARGLVYPCDRSRKDLERAASAPNAGDHELRVDPDGRPPAGAQEITDLDRNHRLRTPDEVVSFDDQVAGRTVAHPFAEVGDFLVWTKRGVPAYQLAVVVDDARFGVTDVVRGRDLLPSTARQLLLYRALQLPEPRWWHLPLVVGPDGRRLAKRHGDTRVASYREAGVPRERIIGLVAWWCGLLDDRAPCAPEDFAARFTTNALPAETITLTPDDHAWLLA